MKHKTLASFIIVVLFILAVIGFSMWARNHAEAPVNTHNGQSSNDLVSMAPTYISIADKNAVYDVEGAYPNFTQASPALNTTIASTFTGDIAQFKNDATSDYALRKKTMTSSDFANYYANGPVYTFTLSDIVVQSNNQYISVVFHENQYTGGAHPFSTIVSFNYDVATKQMFDLSYLYPHDSNYLKEIADQVRTELGMKLALAANEKVLDKNTEQMLNDGTDPTHPGNFQNFTFTPSGITIYFEQYQVAPYVFGEQTVVIPR